MGSKQNEEKWFVVNDPIELSVNIVLFASALHNCSHPEAQRNGETVGCIRINVKLFAVGFESFEFRMENDLLAFVFLFVCPSDAANKKTKTKKFILP